MKVLAGLTAVLLFFIVEYCLVSASLWLFNQASDACFFAGLLIMVLASSMLYQGGKYVVSKIQKIVR